MELAVVVGAPIGVQPLQPFAGQCVAGVERGELEVAADHVVDGGEYFGVGIDEVEGGAFVAEIGEAAVDFAESNAVRMWIGAIDYSTKPNRLS